MLRSSAVLTPKNTRGRPVTKLCLALEMFRRTDEGRTRDAQTFLAHFFGHDRNGTHDRLFVHLPKEVRAELLSSWRIRGKKSALRDADEKVRLTVVDALAAGDIDATIIEDGVTPEILVDWVPLEDWWAFWRGASVPAGAVRKALAIGRDLSLFDERWFLENLRLSSQRLQGTDVICAAMSKDQIVAWLHAVHTSGDASPTGLVAALGWETVLAKTAHEALTYTLDALARQIGLAETGPHDRRSDAPNAKPISQRPPAAAITPAIAPAPHASTAVATSASVARSTAPSVVSVATSTAPQVASREIRPSDVPTPTPGSVSTAPPAAPPEASVESSMGSAAAAEPSKVSTPPMAARPAEPPKPPPLPPAASKPPPLPAAASASVRAPAPSQNPPSVVVEPAPAPPAPVSSPPTARALFGAPRIDDLPPMRAPARTLAGVGGPSLFETTIPVEVDAPSTSASPDDPMWAPPRAEPGDMGWDIVHGVKHPMTSSIQPRYNFESDDEPTSEIALPGEPRRG
jgi:hypothetical protein